MTTATPAKPKKNSKINPAIKAKAAARKKDSKAKLDLPKKLKKLTSRVVKFTGVLAQSWLDQDAEVREKKKTSNRKLTKSNITAKVNDMLNESFMMTSQGITVDWDGAVIDGQHTLNAIVRYYDEADSPTPVSIYVTEGEDPAHFPFYDQGKTRSNDDVFAMANFSSPRDYAGAARLLWIRVNGKRVAGAGKLSPYALVEFAEQYKGLAKSLKFVETFGNEKNEEDRGDFCKSVIPVAYGAALHFLMVHAEGSSQKLADDFFDLLINPEPKSPLAPCKLRQKFNAVRNDPEKTMNRDAKVDYMIAAFNNYCDKIKGPVKVAKGERPQLGGYDNSCGPEIVEEE